MNPWSQRALPVPSPLCSAPNAALQLQPALTFYFFFKQKLQSQNHINPSVNLRSFRSISSHLRTSLTNLRWNTFTSGFSCRERHGTQQTPVRLGRAPPAPCGIGHWGGAARGSRSRRYRAGNTHVAELDLAQLAQLADTAVRGLGLQKELGQGHLLAAEQLPHGGAAPAAASAEKGRENENRAGGRNRGLAASAASSQPGCTRTPPGAAQRSTPSCPVPITSSPVSFRSPPLPAAAAVTAAAAAAAA